MLTWDQMDFGQGIARHAAEAWRFVGSSANGGAFELT
jgi:hypothetical protein